jgi:hypothetical protein
MNMTKLVRSSPEATRQPSSRTSGCMFVTSLDLGDEGQDPDDGH